MKKDAVLPEPENAFADMRKLILKACAYDPKDRYQSAGEMKKALENIQKHPYGLCPKRTECIVTETFKKHIRKQIKGWKSYV